MLFLLLILTLSILPITLPIYAAPPITPKQTYIVITQDTITSSPYYKGGDGSETNPWILEFGTLDLGGGHIYITNFTSGYLVIKNSKVYNGDSVVLNIGADDNVSNVHITIQDSEFHSINSTGYIIRIEADNSIITLKNVTLYDGTANDWWDAILCIEYSENTKVYINESTLHGGGHIIRIANNGDPAPKIIVYNSTLYEVKNAADWRGLIRVDNNPGYPEIYILECMLSAKDSSGSPSAIEIEDEVSKLVINNTVFKAETPYFYYGIYVKSGNLDKLLVYNATVEDSGGTTDHFIAYYAGTSFTEHKLIDITASGLSRDLYHIGGSTPITMDSLVVENVVISNSRYMIGFSPVVSASQIIVKNIVADSISKLLSLPNTDNDIAYLYVRNVTIRNSDDTADIRGIAKANIVDIKVYNTGGNGFYMQNVNNTLFENIYFEYGGWKAFVFDGYSENITIRYFTDIDSSSSGPNPAIAVGPWNTGFVKNLTIEHATIHYDTIIAIYDTSDNVENLIIYNVTVHGSAPANWESYRAGIAIYLAHASNVIIKNFTSVDTTADGIYLDSVDNVEIYWCNISHAGNYAINITGSASNVYVHNNTFWFNTKKPQVYSDSPNSTGVTAVYNLYTDHVSRDADGDGIADTPYTWNGTGGVVDPKPIYFPTGIAYVVLNDTTIPTYASSGTGTATDPYIVSLNLPTIPSTMYYGVLIDNVSVYFVLTGSFGGSPASAIIYVGSNITGEITLKDITITSSGKHGIVFDGTDGHVVFDGDITITNVGGYAIDLEGASNIEVKNIVIDMNFAGYDAIYASNPSNIKIINATISNTPYYSIKMEGTISNILVKDLTQNSGTAGFKFSGTINGLTIRNVNIELNGWSTWDGIEIGTSVSNIYLEDITLKKIEWKGIYIHGSGSNITIKSVTVDGENSYFNHPGIYIEADSAFTITDIRITNSTVKDTIGNEWWIGGISIEKSKDISITNVVISGNYRGIVVQHSDSINISSSTIQNQVYHGIVFYGVTNGRIELSTITNNGGKGIIIHWRDYGGGTYVYSNNIAIKNSTIAYNGINGIHITDNSSNILIAYNVLEHNGYSGANPSEQVALFIDNGCKSITVTWNDFKFNKHSPQAKAPDTVTFDHNAWSDYIILGGHDSDGDGIGDTPYTIPGPTDPTDPNPRMYYLDGSPLLPTPELPILPLLLVATLLILIIIKKRS